MPLARRRRSSSVTLESDGVPWRAGSQRTSNPKASTLHRHHHLQTGSQHLQQPDLQTPEPPHSISGTGTRRTAPPPRCERRDGGRDVVGIRRTATTGEDLRHHKPPARPRHPLPSAADGNPLTPSYVQTRSEVPPPSRRRSGRRRGGEPANRRRRTGVNGRG